MENVLTIDRSDLHKDVPITTQKIYMVYLNLWNYGRGLAIKPEVQFSIFGHKLSSFLSYGTNASKLTKQARQVNPSKKYSTVATNDEDALASEFLEKGTKEIEYVHGHDQGVRMILGFAFEGGKNFYIASDESTVIDKMSLRKEAAFATFLAMAQNARKKGLVLTLS